MPQVVRFSQLLFKSNALVIYPWSSSLLLISVLISRSLRLYLYIYIYYKRQVVVSLFVVQELIDKLLNATNLEFVM